MTEREYAWVQANDTVRIKTEGQFPEEVRVVAVGTASGDKAHTIQVQFENGQKKWIGRSSIVTNIPEGQMPYYLVEQFSKMSDKQFAKIKKGNLKYIQLTRLGHTQPVQGRMKKDRKGNWIATIGTSKQTYKITQKDMRVRHKGKSSPKKRKDSLIQHFTEKVASRPSKKIIVKGRRRKVLKKPKAAPSAVIPSPHDLSFDWFKKVGNEWIHKDKPKVKWNSWRLAEADVAHQKGKTEEEAELRGMTPQALANYWLKKNPKWVEKT